MLFWHERGRDFAARIVFVSMTDIAGNVPSGGRKVVTAIQEAHSETPVHAGVESMAIANPKATFAATVMVSFLVGFVVWGGAILGLDSLVKARHLGSSACKSR